MEDNTQTTVETKFTKEQLKNSEKYRNYTDILSAKLEDEKEYTFDETDKIIKDFLTTKVGGRKK